MERLDEADPIWGQLAEIYRVGRDDRFIKSDRVGSFTAPEGLTNYIREWSPIDRAKLATWVLDRNLAGEHPTVDVAAIEAIRAARPLTISKKLDRFLLMLEHDRFRPGDQLPWRVAASMTPEYVRSMHRKMLWIEAASDNEFYAFGPVLQQAGIVHIDQQGRYSLAYGGFRRLEEMRSSSTSSDQAFVAMWFNLETKDAYESGIVPALARAGYRPLRIDQKEHNNKIDDEIIGEIRRSKFIVADFTCGLVGEGGDRVAVARGGVYYEAGFAQGLGLPVIWMVRSDQIDHVHFDIRQFNQITWNSPEEIQEKLFNRVAAIIGLRQM